MADAPNMSTTPLRSRIAREIDHEGYWERLDNLNAVIRAGTASDEQQMELCHVRDEEIAGTADSLDRADRILAVLGPPAGMAGEFAEVIQSLAEIENIASARHGGELEDAVYVIRITAGSALNKLNAAITAQAARSAADALRAKDAEIARQAEEIARLTTERDEEAVAKAFVGRAFAASDRK